MPHASSEAAPDAAWLQRHVARLRESYRRLTGRDLIPPAVAAADAPAALDAAPFGIVSHGTQADPLFNYANRCALALFAMDWAGFTRLPECRLRERRCGDPGERRADDERAQPTHGIRLLPPGRSRRQA